VVPRLVFAVAFTAFLGGGATVHTKLRALSTGAEWALFDLRRNTFMRQANKTAVQLSFQNAGHQTTRGHSESGSGKISRGCLLP